MTALLQMFVTNTGQVGDVHEEAMRAITSLIEVLGEGFIKYMESFNPFLLNALKNHAEYQVNERCKRYEIFQMGYLTNEMT